MSTNFYAKRIPTVSEREEMEAALISSQWNKLKTLIENATKEYHIGKRSGGWQFLFHSSKAGAPWKDDTLQAIKEYLEREDIEIINEYGDSFTLKQFLVDEIGDCIYNDPKKYINCEQYYKEHPKERIYDLYSHEFITKEGLRFSTSYEFR